MDREQAIKIIKDCKEKSFKRTLYTLNEYHEAIDMAIQALEHTALLEQVRWERDVAISQLHELGYEFGEKIEQKPTDAVQRTSNANKKRVENTLEDAISRQAVEDAIAETIVNGESLGYAVAWDILSDLPSVTVQEKTGRWIHIFMENGDDYFEAWDITGVHTFAAQYRCDKCGFVHTVIEDFGRYLYCPNCGARMEVEE